MSMVVLAIIGVMISGLELAGKSRQMTQATELAREVLEACREMDYDTIPAGPQVYNGKVPDPPDASGFPPAPYPSTSVDGREYTIQVSVAPRGTSLKVVTVEVFWGERSKISLETFLHSS